MCFKPILVLAFISLATASIVPAVEVLQGPSSRTTVYGPDGSILDSTAPGGTVVINGRGAGLVAAGAALLPNAGPPIVVSGPAGSIATSYTLAGPALVPAVGPIIAASQEGAYVHDSNSDYNNGLYRGDY